MNNQRVLNVFGSLTKWIYKNSDKILISSNGFEQSIVDKGNFKDKIVYFPNWADRDMASDTQVSLPQLPQGFIVMFAGNMGEAQDFEHIMEAALRLRDHKDIHFVIVGNGRKYEWVDTFVHDNYLDEQVHLLGRYPSEAMPAFFNQADVMLISLKDVSIFNLTVPAKLQAYMAAGKPIVAMMNGEGPRIIADAQCGWFVSAGDAKGLASCILEMASLDQDELKQKGSNARMYQIEHFNIDRCMLHLEKLLMLNDLRQ